MTKNHTIADNLTIGSNSFGLLRLLAASAVVVSHAWLVTSGSYASEPLLVETGFSLGWHAVNLFFALSGLLIAGSLHHTRSLIQFAWSRFLRIFPRPDYRNLCDPDFGSIVCGGRRPGRWRPSPNIWPATFC